MSVHFKLTHNKETRRFALAASNEGLFDEVMERVTSTVGTKELNLFWKDVDSPSISRPSFPLDTPDDLKRAIAHIVAHNEENKPPCVHLVVELAVADAVLVQQQTGVAPAAVAVADLAAEADEMKAMVADLRALQQEFGVESEQEYARSRNVEAKSEELRRLFQEYGIEAAAAEPSVVKQAEAVDEPSAVAQAQEAAAEPEQAQEAAAEEQEEEKEGEEQAQEAAPEEEEDCLDALERHLQAAADAISKELRPLAEAAEIKLAAAVNSVKKGVACAAEVLEAAARSGMKEVTEFFDKLNENTECEASHSTEVASEASEEEKDKEGRVEKKKCEDCEALKARVIELEMELMKERFARQFIRPDMESESGESGDDEGVNGVPGADAMADMLRMEEVD